jgi:hypothetical protein
MAGRLPEALDERLVAAAAGQPVGATRASVEVPDAPVRLYVAPANFAGQGFAWARAVETHLEGVAARSMAPVTAEGFAFPADDPVPEHVAAGSRAWQRAQRTAVERFSHVLVEAELPLFPRLGDGSVLSEVRSLRRAGLRVATVSHGSDVRSPSAHAAREPWSPYLEPSWGDGPVLEEQSRRNRRLLAQLRDEGVPAFVSTPDLLVDVPWATWLPVVVDPARWESGRRPLERAVPVVVHVPSRGVVKGTDLVEPVLRDLDAEGLIEYRTVRGVPWSRMPALYGEADVVLDQFRLGSYGVAACEALAAGRVVVSHVGEQVRERVRATGDELPVVQADPSTLQEVLRDVVTDRERYREIAARGPGFVRALHDGSTSARVLSGFLDRDGR